MSTGKVAAVIDHGRSRETKQLYLRFLFESQNQTADQIRHKQVR